MIEFSGIDVVVDRRLSEDRIRSGVAATLSVDRTRVAVIRDMLQYPESGAADVVCVVSQASGDFRQVLSVQCKPMSLSMHHVLDVLALLSVKLGARVLAPDEGPNPYLMWLIESGCPPRKVALDEVAFDEDGYVIKNM